MLALGGGVVDLASGLSTGKCPVAHGFIATSWWREYNASIKKAPANGWSLNQRFEKKLPTSVPYALRLPKVQKNSK